MALRHNNTSQLVPPVDLNPLLKNESPYYNNLNRPPKNAHDYADRLNKILSYGGYVSHMRSADSSQTFNLYNLVTILDGEVIAPNAVDIKARYGIIVTEKDDSGYYVVCTFCPNFVYPTEVILFDTANIGNVLHADAGVLLTGMSLAGSVSVAKITGTSSIFFAGTTRLF